MARVPVPEDYDADVVPLPSDLEYDDYETAVEGHAGRRAMVREDEDGRYVGVHEALVEDVAEFLGVDVASTSDTTDDGVDATSTTIGVDVDAIDASIESGECYWCDEYDGANVAQHASSAHPEAWRDYKDAADSG